MHTYALILNYSRYILRKRFMENDIVSKKTLAFSLYVALIELYLNVLASIDGRGHHFLTLLQEKRLRRLLSHAQRSPWWNAHFKKHSVVIKDIKNIDDLTKLPIVTRAELANIPPRELFTKKIRNASLEWGQSSGSTTGTPLVWAFEKSLLRLDIVAFFLKQFQNHGFSFKEHSQKKFFVDLNPIDTKKDAFRFFRGGEFYVNKNDPNIHEKVGQISKKIEELGGCVLNTAPNELFFFVEKLQELNLHPPILFCRIGGLPLTEENARKKTETYLTCPAKEAYGAKELGCLGSECEKHRGLFHLYAGRVIAETVDDNGKRIPDGETGRILITCLDNTVMPLVRYEIGDRGALFTKKVCPCNNASPLIKIEGRISDLLELKNGSRHSPKLIYKLLTQEPLLSHIKKIQVRQEKIDHVVILLETTPFVLEEVGQKVRKKIERAYNQSFSVSLRCLEETRKEGAKFCQFMPLAKFQILEKGSENNPMMHQTTE